MVQDPLHVGEGRVPPGLVGHRDGVWKVPRQFTLFVEELSTDFCSLDMGRQLLALISFLQHVFRITCILKGFEGVTCANENEDDNDTKNEPIASC